MDTVLPGAPAAVPPPPPGQPPRRSATLLLAPVELVLGTGAPPPPPGPAPGRPPPGPPPANSSVPSANEVREESAGGASTPREREIEVLLNSPGSKEVICLGCEQWRKARGMPSHSVHCDAAPRILSFAAAQVSYPERAWDLFVECANKRGIAAPIKTFWVAERNDDPVLVAAYNHQLGRVGIGRRSCAEQEARELLSAAACAQSDS